MTLKLLIKNYTSELLLLVFTLCGITLFWSGYEKVVELTPLYISVSIILVICKSQNRRDLCRAFSITALIGLTAEYIGVHTGLLFGNYSYGTKMGLLVLGVPLLIGPLWALVTICFWSLTHKIASVKRVPLLAVGTVLYDVVLEHFAVRYGLWQWKESVPPSNTVGWFIVSLAIYSIFAYKKYSFKIQRIGLVILLLQILFFATLILLY